MKRASWHVRVGAIVVLWLVGAGVCGVLALQGELKDWFVVHVLLLGALSNAILIWSTHFATALLRLPARDSRRWEAYRLAVFNVGAVAVVWGVWARNTESVWAGAALTGGVAVAHAVVLLARKRRALPSRFGPTIRYYIAASALLAGGVSLGAILTPHDLSHAAHERFEFAHIALNLLGWIGLTVIGTLVTLWPTMLRTTVSDRAELSSRRALPVLVIAVLAVGGGALVDSRAIAIAGMVLFLAGLALNGVALVYSARLKLPRDFATLSVLAAMLWFVAAIIVATVALVRADDWEAVIDGAKVLGVPLLVGFAAQLLIGALSYLVPVVLGGGPAMARSTLMVLHGAAVPRLAAVNVGLVAYLMIESDELSGAALAISVAALATFVPLVARAVMVARSGVPIEGAPGAA